MTVVLAFVVFGETLGAAPAPRRRARARRRDPGDRRRTARRAWPRCRRDRARRRRHPRRRPRHRRRARRGRRTPSTCTGRSTREQPLGDRPPGDDRGDRRARHRGGRRGHRGADRPPRPRAGPALVARIDADHGRPRRARQRHLGRRAPLRVGHADPGARPRQRAAAAAARDRHAPDHEPPRAAAAHPHPGGLVVEVTDGTAEYNADHYRISSSTTSPRRRSSGSRVASAKELAPHGGTAVALTPGWLRSEAMLEHYGVTEENWRDGPQPALRCISETPRFVGRAVAALAADPDSPAATASRSRAAASPRSTASPTSTARAPTAGATWSRSRTRTSRPDATGYR